jgi:gp16 family phage-associated protein
VSLSVTPAQIAKIKQGFRDRGETVADFCRKNQLDYDVTQRVLQGRSKGVRGETHRAMVALGLKKAVAA